MLMVAATTPLGRSGASKSMSRSISDDFVIKPNGCRARASTSTIAARELQLALDRLIGISDDAERDHLRLVSRCGQFAQQQFDCVVLCDQLGLEIEARRKIQIAVRRPRKTVDAAVLAAPVRIDRAIEADVGRLVVGDQALCGLERCRRRQAPASFVVTLVCRAYAARPRPLRRRARARPIRSGAQCSRPRRVPCGPTNGYRDGFLGIVFVCICDTHRAWTRLTSILYIYTVSEIRRFPALKICCAESPAPAKPGLRARLRRAAPCSSGDRRRAPPRRPC